MSLDYDELRKFLAENLRVEMDKRHDDYYDASQRVAVKLFLGETLISEDSISILEGTSSSGY